MNSTRRGFLTVTGAAATLALTGGGAWQTVAQVRGNTVGHVTSTFAPTKADAVRILALDGNGHSYSRIVELEVYGS